MTDRMYGARWALEEIEGDFHTGIRELDMAAHIRELQAELAELKLQHIASVSQAIELQAENAKLKEELETERIRLAECGVASLMNTRTGIPERIQRDNPYWSESYGAVCRAVDEQISLREEVCKLKAERREFGLLCALQTVNAAIGEASEGGDGMPLRMAKIDYVAIVEQEMTK